MPLKLELKELFEQFNQLKVIVIGDVMLDKYVYGNADRISPEAPVPIVSIKKTESRLGGAANVALNIKALGAEPILVSIIGKDEDATIFNELLSSHAISNEFILLQEQRTTTSKTRILAQNHQMLRLDKEVTSEIDAQSEQNILKALKEIIEIHQPQVCILEDYNKGLLTDRLIREITIICLENKIPVAVDPKKNNFFSYQLCTLFKPNLREIKESLQVNFNEENLDDLNNVSSILHKQLHNAITLITLGDKGIYLRGGNEVYKMQAHVRKVSDVSGAGDTVISVASLCLAAKTSLSILIELSNIAGGMVCEYAGVVSINKEQLFNEACNLMA